MLFFSSPSSSPKKFTRLKREDYHRTQHDSVFSSWEILIGDCDWEDYYLGKDGAQRYRTHNLPNGSSCPGLYELGITVVPKRHDGHKSRKHQSKNIIVVYLGQTNNVRTRLQKYGRVGAHLNAGKVVGSATNDGINECPGLFKKVFSRGYSIMFRWAPMIDKKKAEETEADLLNVFDYAWNTCGNGSCRSNEIFQKIDSKSNRKAISIVKKLHLKNSAFSWKAGIKIDESVPSNITKANKSFLLPRVLKFRKSQLQFVDKNDTYCNCNCNNNEICGVAIGNGSVCKNMPSPGKKRCEDHKGKKIVGMDSVVVTVSQTHQESTIYKTQCGLVLVDGSLCANVPAYGRKRCDLHRGMRNKLDIIRNTPKVEPDLSAEKETSVKNCSSVQSLKADDKDDNCGEEHGMCGVVNGDGTKCRKNPVPGRKRCEEHKGRKVSKMVLPRLSIKVLKNTDNSVVCGACMEDGSTCMKIPTRGRKRCELHKGYDPGELERRGQISSPAVLTLLTISGVYKTGVASTASKSLYGPSPMKMTPSDLPPVKHKANLGCSPYSTASWIGIPTLFRPKPAMPTVPAAKPGITLLDAQANMKSLSTTSGPGLDPSVVTKAARSVVSSPTEPREKGLSNKTLQEDVLSAQPNGVWMSLQSGSVHRTWCRVVEEGSLVSQLSQRKRCPKSTT